MSQDWATGRLTPQQQLAALTAQYSTEPQAGRCKACGGDGGSSKRGVLICRTCHGLGYCFESDLDMIEHFIKEAGGVNSFCDRMDISKMTVSRYRNAERKINSFCVAWMHSECQKAFYRRENARLKRAIK